jgi:tetratricopeptide (TPR) repeat protein
VNPEFVAALKKNWIGLGVSIFLVAMGLLLGFGKEDPPESGGGASSGNGSNAVAAVVEPVNKGSLTPFGSSPMRIRKAEATALRYKRILDESQSEEEIELTLSRLANVYQSYLHDYDEAAFYFQKLLNDFPDSEYVLHAYVRLSQIYYRLEDYGSEMQVYETVMREYPPESEEYKWAMASSTGEIDE